MSVQVFVSYSREDVAVVRPIVAFLEQDFVVWWDDDIIGGTEFEKEILQDKVQTAQVVVVVWSANAARSTWVRDESLAAVNRTKCIPILLDNTSLPPHLAKLAGRDLRTRNGCEDVRELRKLARDIALHLAHLSKLTGADISEQVPESGSGLGRALLRRLRAPGPVDVAVSVGGVVVILMVALLLVSTSPRDVMKEVAQQFRCTSSDPSKEVVLVPAPNRSKAPITITEDQWKMLSLGCEDDWQKSVRTTNTSGISHPPLLTQSTDKEWNEQAKELIRAGKYTEVRSLLEDRAKTQPAARNQLGVLELFERGNGAAAFREFVIAAAQGDRLAKANLGLSYIYGIGTKVNPTYGTELIEGSIHEGLDPKEASWLIRKAPSFMEVENYAEIIKSLQLQKDSPVALTALGTMTGQGFALCAPTCSEAAKEYAEKLRGMGEPALAKLVEASAMARVRDHGVIRPTDERAHKLELSGRDRFRPQSSKGEN